MVGRRTVRALVLLAAGAVLAILAPASPAQAHAFLSESNPADGAVLSTAPRVLQLAFSESVVLSATHVDVVDSSGRHYTPTHLRLVGGGEDTEDPVSIVADLPPLPHSAYRISWQTLSSDDLHKTSGVLVFGVDSPVSASAFVEPTPRAEEAVLRWLLFACVAGSLGGWFGMLLYRRAGGAERSIRRCRRIAVVAPAAGALAAAGLLVDQVMTSGSSLGRLFATDYGAQWTMREAGFLMLVALAILPSRRRLAGMLAVATGAVCLGSALLGHSGAGAGWVSTRVAADALHLAAAATWVGLLLVALLVVLPDVRAGGAAAVTARAVLRRYALPATACVSVIAVTGVYLASGVVGSVDAALRTGYGRTLLLKIAVVGVIGVLGLVNARRLHGRRQGVTPRRTVAAEAMLALAVLGLTAILTGGQPAREPQFVASPALRTVPVVDSGVADLQETLALRPNRPGRNVAVISVHDSRRPALAPVRRVLVSVVDVDGHSGSPVLAQRLGDGGWSAALTFQAAGRTHLRVTVQRPGLPDAVQVYRWVIGGAQAAQTRPALVSTRPIDAALRTLSGVLAVLVAAAWVGTEWRSRVTRTRREAIVEVTGALTPRAVDLVDAG